MKRFLKEPGHLDSYEGLGVDYISGKPPVLKLFDENGAIVETLTLSDMSTQQLHELVQSKGFKKKKAVASEL